MFGGKGGGSLLYRGMNHFGFSSYGSDFGEMQYAGVRETKGGAKLNHRYKQTCLSNILNYLSYLGLFNLVVTSVAIYASEQDEYI